MVSTVYYNTLYSNLQLLPDSVQAQVFEYVGNLVLKYYKEENSKNGELESSETTPYRNFGQFKGKIKLAEDFNEPMDDFKEY